MNTAKMVSFNGNFKYRQKAELFIVAAYVVSLYPNINRQVLRNALVQ